MISNSKPLFSQNIIVHESALNDEKGFFFHALVNRIKKWSHLPSFNSMTQASITLINTLRFQEMLIGELSSDGYDDFVLAACIQSELIKHCFLQG